ncbi:MAG: polysaccharide deacetylase family protein [Thermodesulfobacteriota bacterium]
MKETQPIPQAYFIGLASYIAAGAFLFIHPAFSAAVLSGFVVICLGAPFFPGAGIFLPAIRRGGKDSSAVALTFDDGPDPLTTPFLLNILARRGVKATFFCHRPQGGKISRSHGKYPAGRPLHREPYISP